MNKGMNEFRDLVDRVIQGDRPAELVLLQTLDGPVTRMVRHVLRGGTQPHVLAQRVRLEIERLKLDGRHPSLASAPLAEQVAQNICASMIKHLRLQPCSWASLWDTVIS